MVTLKKDLLQWTIFLEFANVLFPDSPTGMFPITTILLLHFLALATDHWAAVDREIAEYFLMRTLTTYETDNDWNSGTSKCVDMSNVVHKISAYLRKFPCFQFNGHQPVTGQTMTVDAQWNVVVSVLNKMPNARPYENMPASYIGDIWTRLGSTCRTHVSRTTLMTLHVFFTSSKVALNDRTPRLRTDLESSRYTASTSTSHMRAHSPTDRVDVRGSTEARYGGKQKYIDIDDEFISLTSKFKTGKTSLDILLQRDTQPNTLKAEVMMEENIYELKIYRYDIYAYIIVLVVNKLFPNLYTGRTT